MNVYGREVGFKFTTGASIELAKLCPNGDISKLASVLNGKKDTAESLTIAVKVICLLSNGYEEAKKFELRTEGIVYTPNPLTFDEVLSLPVRTIRGLEAVAMKQIKDDAQTEVETEAPKKE